MSRSDQFPRCLRNIPTLGRKGRVVQVRDLGVVGRKMAHASVYAVALAVILAVLVWGPLGVLAALCLLPWVLLVGANYHRGIVVSSRHGVLVVPASTPDGTVVQFITLRKIRLLACSRVIPITDVTRVFIDTRRTKRVEKNAKGKSRTVTEVTYGLTLTGDFGSHSLDFSSRQRRDECRQAIQTCAKDLGHKVAIGGSMEVM